MYLDDPEQSRTRIVVKNPLIFRGSKLHPLFYTEKRTAHAATILVIAGYLDACESRGGYPEFFPVVVRESEDFLAFIGRMIRSNPDYAASTFGVRELVFDGSLIIQIIRYLAACLALSPAVFLEEYFLSLASEQPRPRNPTDHDFQTPA